MKDFSELKSAFQGNFRSKNTKLHMLYNNNGTTVGVFNYGARITHFNFQGKDVVLGFDSLQKYIKANERYHGVTVGRFANRIADGKFKIGDKSYQLEINNGKNNLHSGSNGLHDQVWEIESATVNSMELSTNIAAWEDGFPGDFLCKVKFHLTDLDELHINYFAQANQDTFVNLTNHAYFNLNGEGEGDILNHKIKINAFKYVPINEDCIPLGELENVRSTPFDFTQLKKISDGVYLPHEQLRVGNGYDHSYHLNKDQSGITLAAQVIGDQSNIQLTVLTSEPGVQFYTGNFLNGTDVGKSGKPYLQRYGFCLETQHHPDSPNQINFPSTLLKANEVYESQTIYKLELLH